MKILGINISHDSSSCLLEDGKIVYFIEDQRLTRVKDYLITDHDYDSLEDESFVPHFIEKLKTYTNNVDYVIFSSYGREDTDEICDNDDIIIELYLKAFAENGISFGECIFEPSHHHIHHAANAFYASGFDDAVCLIMDGGGAIYPNENIVKELIGNVESFDGGKNMFREMESFFEFSYDSEPKKLKQVWGYIKSNPESADPGPIYYDETIVFHYDNDVLTTTSSNGQMFNGVSHCMGLNDGNDAGKVMGLASYATDSIGEYEFEKVDWYIEVAGEWITSYDIKEILFIKKPDFDVDSFEGIDFYIKANLAKKLQDETLKHTNRLIKQALELSSSRNLVISGGYALNCVNNYKYLDNLPDDVKIFVDPISNDSGTAIGAAKLLWYKLTGSKEKNKLNSLYLG